MRFLSSLILASLLVLSITTPALAQTSNQPPAGAAATANKPIQQKFGTTMCRDKVLCPNVTGNLDFKYADVANKCIREDFSLNSASGSGFFENFGMDTNNCLLLKSDAVTRSADRVNIVPQCCVVQQASSCALHCELVTAP